MKIHLRGIVTLLFFLFTFTLINCQYEDDSQSIDSIDESQKVISKIVTGKDVPFIIDFIKSRSNDDLEFIIKDEGTPNAMQRNDEDDLILTSVLTDYVNQVTNSSGISNYSFEMEEISDGDGYYFLNLVVKEYNDNYYISIIKYVPDPLWLTSSTRSQDFSEYTGSMYFYDEQGVYLANMTFNDGSSTDFGYDPPCADGGNGDWIGDNDIDGAGLGGVICDANFIGCGGTNSNDIHDPGIGSCGVGPDYPGSYWELTCNDEGTGYDGTGTTWADAFNNYLQDPCGYGDTGSGSSGTGDNNNCNTTCDFPLEVDENCNCVEAEPVVVNNNVGVIVSLGRTCAKLNRLLSNTMFSEALSDLQQEALNPTGNESERGFEISKDENGITTTNFVQGGFDGVKLATGGNIIGGMHIHTNDGNPMFSGQDIVQLRNTYHNGHIGNSNLLHQDVFSILVVKDGAGTQTYAISISDYNLLSYIANVIDGNNKGRTLDKILQKKYDNAINGTTANAYMQDLLKYINGITPTPAINLFKLNNAGTAFETVTLDADNNDNPIATPCY